MTNRGPWKDSKQLAGADTLDNPGPLPVHAPLLRLDVQSVAEYTSGIDGYLFDEEGPFLMSVAQQCTGRGAIVEIGSYCGKSTIWLAAGSKRGAGAPIYAVDHHQGSPEHRIGPSFTSTEMRFRTAISGASCDDIVTAVVTTSEAAASTWNIPIEILFIDGGHDYASVRSDFDRWTPFLVPGGTVMFHDSNGYWPGVWRVIQESIFRGAHYNDILCCRTITAARKGPSRSMWATLGDWRRILVRRLEVWQHTRRSLRFWRSARHE